MKSNKFYLFTTNILKLLCMERDRLLGVSYAQFRGGGPSAPKFLGTGPSTYTGTHTEQKRRREFSILAQVWSLPFSIRVLVRTLLESSRRSPYPSPSRLRGTNITHLSFPTPRCLRPLVLGASPLDPLQ